MSQTRVIVNNSESESDNEIREVKVIKKRIKKKKKIIPKRPMTPYFLFCQEKRQEYINSDNQRKLTAKELGSMWKNLPDEQKNSFIKQYEKDKKKYDEDKQKLKEKSEEEEDDDDDDNDDNDDDSEVDQMPNIKKAKAKVSKEKNEKYNKIPCNCGECDDCMRRKKIKREEEEEFEDNKLAKKRAKIRVEDEYDD